MGGVFEVICKALPFEACLNIIQGTLHNDYSNHHQHKLSRKQGTSPYHAICHF